MRFKIPLAAACLALATLSLPAVSSAAALPGASQSTAKLGAQSTLTEAVQYRRDGWRRGGWDRDRGGWGRCRAWRNECADRWGWGGPRFRRCLWRHGC
jgi:hypothetical protein